VYNRILVTRRRTPRLHLASLLAALAPAGAARAQTVSDEAHRGACDTAGVQGISDQLVAVQMCLRPGVFVEFVPHANVTLTSTRIHAYLVSAARDALWTAAARLDLQINSAFRTLADQYVLYYSGACGLAATPGNSNHETGRAVDLQNWSAAVSAMTAAGCTHTYPTSDPVHFDCPGEDLRADSVRAFQRLWNVNNPSDTIAEDGVYGPVTEARLARSPAAGFANPADCSAPATPDWAARFVAQSFPLAGSGALTMRAGETQAAWIDMRNVGGRAWDARTRLATTGPRDRTSPFAGGDWVGPNRPAAVSGSVAPDGTFRFAFNLHAPATPGTYDEHFGMVEEGVAWFGDPGQGGPADTLLEARIEVVPALAADAGADSGMDGGARGDAGARDGASGADAEGDAGYRVLPDGARVPLDPAMGGCGCSAPGSSAATRVGAAWALFGALVARCARRRRGRRVARRPSVDR
jgi:hypothetical protein